MESTSSQSYLASGLHLQQPVFSVTVWTLTPKFQMAFSVNYIGGALREILLAEGIDGFQRNQY